MLLNDDYDSIVECNEMCNRAGLDSISTGAVVAFAVECFENGRIDEKTTGGLKLGWGRADEIVKLTEMIANRDGIGTSTLFEICFCLKVDSHPGQIWAHSNLFPG